METNRDPSLAQLIRSAFERKLLDVHTALPAIVESYDEQKQTVDATPQILAPVTDEEGETTMVPLPTVVACPVLFPGANGFRLTFPIAKGDTVMLVFTEASIDLWLQNGGQVDPKDLRRFHFSDAVAVPGLKPSSKPWNGASTSDATLGHDTGVLATFKSDRVEIGGGAQWVALAQKVKDELDRIHTYMTALDTVLRIPVNEPGNGSPSAFQTAISGALAAVQYPTPSSVASTTLKAD